MSKNHPDGWSGAGTPYGNILVRDLGEVFEAEDSGPRGALEEVNPGLDGRGRGCLSVLILSYVADRIILGLRESSHDRHPVELAGDGLKLGAGDVFFESRIEVEEVRINLFLGEACGHSYSIKENTLND